MRYLLRSAVIQDQIQASVPLNSCEAVNCCQVRQYLVPVCLEAQRQQRWLYIRICSLHLLVACIATTGVKHTVRHEWHGDHVSTAVRRVG